MLGKLTPYAGLALLEMASVLLLGWIIFGVYVKGSVITLFLLSIPFILAALSLGLLISTIAKDQAQALQYTLLTMLPSVLLSGFMFPRETMPGPIYVISFALPVTYFLQVLRGVIVRGASFGELFHNGLALSLLAISLILISTARFRKTVS
jgi:ABC-type multidrug transport system permease subunit